MATTHDAVAAVIKAAGFDAMARDYLAASEERRVRIVNAMTRNIGNDRNLGPQMAVKFCRLACQANGWRWL